jgi:hypothetical protein
MKYWYYFWLICFVLAGSAFGVIALIVLVGGIKDLRHMFAKLARHADSGDAPLDSH